MDNNNEKEKSGLARLYAYLQKLERKRLKNKLKQLEKKQHTSTCYKDGKPCECSGLCRENC
jgi:7-cyano-7-deazaguanine synthase in queuosine biosynthesis